MDLTEGRSLTPTEKHLNVLLEIHDYLQSAILALPVGLYSSPMSESFCNARRECESEVRETMLTAGLVRYENGGSIAQILNGEIFVK